MIIYYNFSVFPRISTKGTISRHPAEGSGRLSGYPEAPVLSTAQNSSMEMFCMEFTRCFQCMETVANYPCPHCGYDPGAQSVFPYALRPGTILNGKYAVGTVLGQGGFGITYVGWDLALENKVAVKEYFPSAQVTRSLSTSGTLQWYNTESARVARESGKEMFLKEARKMSRVRDIPQSVQVLDLFRQNETAYIVMDFIEGQTLKAYLKQHGPLGWAEAETFFLPVIYAMARIHQAGLIHRDISPDNLMLQSNGSVRSLDLGAAKDLNINSGASSMQVAKSGFSPPEQYTSRGSSGPWTDVYALAATMYYSLTGVLPPAAMDLLSGETLRWDHPRLKAVPKNVLTALQKAMVLQPDKRTQAMLEFAHQLTTPGQDRNPDGNRNQASSGESQGSQGDSDTGTASREQPKAQAAPTQPKAQAAPARPDFQRKEWETPGGIPQTKKKSGGGFFKFLLAVVVIGITCFFTIHEWEYATCTEPKKCSICGMTSGEPLGHNWVPASCLMPKHCKICGASEGTAAGHQWVDATYSSPKHCTACNQTSGTVRGYLGFIGGTWESAVYGGQRGNALHLTTTIDGMRKMTVNLKIEMNSGARCYDWKLYGRVNGVWKQIGTIHLDDGNGESSLTLTGDGTEVIDWIGVHPTANGGYSWTMWLYITDAQQN